jgi:hypothetical protein
MTERFRKGDRIFCGQFGLCTVESGTKQTHDWHDGDGPCDIITVRPDNVNVQLDNGICRLQRSSAQKLTKAQSDALLGFRAAGIDGSIKEFALRKFKAGISPRVIADQLKAAAVILEAAHAA